MNRRRGWFATLAGAILLAGCVSQPSPSTVPGSASPSFVPSSATASPTPSQSPSPTTTPEPALSLALPERRDDRKIQFSITPKVSADGDGQLEIRVKNLTKQRIDEIVLRWPTKLRDTLFMAPFRPTKDRVAEGGPPLHFAWTRWVDGPGELHEPAGTTSLGWGPLLPGAELSIPILVTRRAPGPVAFDLQFLAGVPHTGAAPAGGDALLSNADGDSAETRVEVP